MPNLDFLVHLPLLGIDEELLPFGEVPICSSVHPTNELTGQNANLQTFPKQ